MIRGVALALGVLLVPVALLVGINAIDESLSPEAQALLTAPKAPSPSEGNAYVHLLGIGAPEGEKPYAAGLKVIETLRQQDEREFRWTKDWETAANAGNANVDRSVTKACSTSAKSCFENVAGKAEVRAAVVNHAPLMSRYAEIRAMPDYAETYYPMGFVLHRSASQLSIHQLVLATAAVHVQGGDLEAAVHELEQENAFQRKVAAHAAMLSTKVVALIHLQMQALFISDLARTQPPAAKYLPRLEALVRPLSAAEADMTKVLTLEAASQAALLREDAVVRLVRMDGGDMAWLAPLFYRERETINIYAAQNALRRKVADVPATQFAAEAQNATRAADALVPSGGLRNVINPVGQVRLWEMADFDVLPSVGRLHDTQGILALVATQLALRAAGATTPAAIEQALAGPLGAVRPDPYTGKPMVYEAKDNSLGFASPAQPSSLAANIRKRFGGRVAVVL
jgi:hypothetical protein